MTKEPNEKKTRNTFKKSEVYRIQLGQKLRTRRLTLGYLIEDMHVMTEISQKTCSSIEKGEADGIDYYIEYAKALNYDLTELFAIEITYEPRHSLPEDRLQTASLAKKIWSLMVEEDFFKEETFVGQIKARLIEKKLIEDSDTLSSDISGILLAWCNEKNPVIKKREDKVKGNNVYILVKKEENV